jgi:hypothetical protein
MTRDPKKGNTIETIPLLLWLLLPYQDGNYRQSYHPTIHHIQSLMIVGPSIYIHVHQMKGLLTLIVAFVRPYCDNPKKNIKTWGSKFQKKNIGGMAV